MLQKNEIYETEITDITVDGLGVGRADGIAVFVADMLPGEKGTVKIIKTAKSYAVGRVEKLAAPSPERVAPPCPYYKSCGGCSIMHMEYFAQLAAKHRRVAACIKNIAGSEAEVLFPLPAREQFRYRNKTSFPVRAGEAGPVIGCFERRSHSVVDTRCCLLQSDAADACVEAVRRWMKKYQVAPYDEQSAKGVVRHVVVRINTYGDVMVGLVINADELPYERELVRELRLRVSEVISIVANINKKRTNTILGRETKLIFGAPRLDEQIGGLNFRISLNSFLQVNHEQTELLYTQVFKYARLLPGEVVADLYCGAGTMSLMAARLAGKVYGIELVEDAVADARINAQDNGIENAEFIAGDCAAVFGGILKKESRLDAVIVDPPRKGLEPKVIADIAASGAGRVIYVSCDPATLARDIGIFEKSGYKAKTVQPVDMFPQTTHIESVALLSKV